jgi:hypothetical protein
MFKARVRKGQLAKRQPLVWDLGADQIHIAAGMLPDTHTLRQ